MDENEVEWFSLIFGYRKTIVMALLILLAIIFRIKGYIDGGQLVDLLKNTTLAFFGANGFEHLTLTVRQYINSKGQKMASVLTDSGTSDTSTPTPPTAS
jgi:hypothetical protein